MFTYSRVFKKDRIEYEVIVALTEKAEWVLEDIGIRKPRQREPRYQRVEIMGDFRYSDLTYGEVLKAVRDKLEEIVGKEEVNKTYVEAWNYIGRDLEK